MSGILTRLEVALPEEFAAKATDVDFLGVFTQLTMQGLGFLKIQE